MSKWKRVSCLFTLTISPCVKPCCGVWKLFHILCLLYTLMCEMTAGYGRGLSFGIIILPIYSGGCRRGGRRSVDHALFRTHAQKYAQNQVLHLLSDDRAAKFAECLLQLQFDNREERSRVAVAEIL